MKRPPVVLALVLACAAAPGPAAELSERGTAMFDAMIGAMDAMGLVERGRKHRSGAGESSDWSSALPSSGFGMPGASGFGIPGASAFGMPGASAFGMPGASPFGMPGASAFGMPGASPFGMPGASPFGMPGASPFGMPGASAFGMPGASAFGMPGSSPFGGFTNPMSPGSSMPWSGGGMPWGGGGMPWSGGLPMPSMPATPWGGRTKGPASSEFLDGAWEGQGGELLLIRRGMFRIYADAETYRDGHLQVQGERLQLKDAESGRARDYEMRHQGDQLVLRTPEGDVLLYRRLSTDAQGGR